MNHDKYSFVPPSRPTTYLRGEEGEFERSAQEAANVEGRGITQLIEDQTGKWPTHPNNYFGEPNAVLGLKNFAAAYSEYCRGNPDISREDVVKCADKCTYHIGEKLGPMALKRVASYINAGISDLSEEHSQPPQTFAL